MILPAQRSIYLIGGLLGLAIIASFWPSVYPLWLGLTLLSLVMAAWDALHVWCTPAITVTRQAPSSVPVGIQRPFSLTLSHQAPRPLQLQVFDHAPPPLQQQGMPVNVHVAPGHYAKPSYLIRPLARGKYCLPLVQLRILSPWQLWWHDRKQVLESEVRVYPNFAAIAQYALLATDNQLSQIGIRKRQRRGEGQDFHQLREYRAGDSLRQIDWKASARMQKPISREYQDERDQEIIFLLDCGHRMQARDGDLSHFDHTLNALLLLAYVALKQGDAVGLSTFGGIQRWLPPRKGQVSLNQLLNALYDLHPTTQAPDYSQAATEVLVRQKKRALVVLVSNLRDEDTDDLVPALHLLRKRHLLLFASMREQALDQQLNLPTEQLADAIEQAAILNYLQQRQQTLEKVRTSGVQAFDVAPPELSTSLINRYLDLKRSGRL